MSGKGKFELEQRLSRRFQVKMVIEGLLVGLVAGGVVTLYRLSLSWAEKGMRFFTEAATGNALLMLAWFAVLGVLLIVVGRLVCWEPMTSGSGIPQTQAEVLGQADAPWHRVILAKFIEGSLGAFVGLSLGREGPSVQLGGMSGKAVSRVLKRGRGEERLLVTCGAAAGMSAAFHAPLTGVLFALEEIHKEFRAPLILSVMCSAIASDFLVSQVLGVNPVLSLVFVIDLPRRYYLFVVLLGIVCGVLGAFHNAGMFWIQGQYSRIRTHIPYFRYAIPFALAGVVAFTVPQLNCGGDALIELLDESDELNLSLLAALLLGKYLFTAICFGSGAPGGTLFPLVVMGSLTGAVCAGVFGAVFGFPEMYFPNFIALGIAGFFAGAIRAPVTAVVLVFELTGSLDALLSVSIVSVLAYVTANLLKTDGFYEHLLAAQLQTSIDDPNVTGYGREKVLQTVRVGAGSKLEGMKVCEVPWPDGLRVMTIGRAGTEIIPTGATELCAMDELLVMVGESSTEDAILKLKIMAKSSLAEG